MSGISGINRIRDTTFENCTFTRIVMDGKTLYAGGDFYHTQAPSATPTVTGMSASSGNSSVNIQDAFNVPAELSITQFSPETIEALKNALGYGDVVVKCGWCGQWGAVKTTCKYCGQAIDPK